MRLAEMSSIALVIFLVDWTDLIRRFSARSWPPAISAAPSGRRVGGDVEVLAELLEGRLEGVLVELAAVADLGHEAAVAGVEVREQVLLVPAHVGHGDLIEVAAGPGVEHHDLGF